MEAERALASVGGPRKIALGRGSGEGPGPADTCAASVQSAPQLCLSLGIGSCPTSLYLPVPGNAILLLARDVFLVSINIKTYLKW